MENDENISSKELENKKLVLIPKIEDYIEYMLNVITKLPRVEKFSIGNEYKTSMYSMLENSLYTAKINRKENIKETLKLLNTIDAELNSQRIFLRIMKRRFFPLRFFLQKRQAQWKQFIRHLTSWHH